MQKIGNEGGARGWLIAVLLYLLAAFSMASVGLLSPLALRVTASLGAPAAAIGLAIALFSLPSALTATIGGGLVDRVGPRAILIASPIVVAIGDAIMATARHVVLLDIGMVLIGSGYVGVMLGGPSLFIRAYDGAMRTRIMAFWPTYAPIGFALGLLLSVPFTGGMDWHFAFLLHGIVALLLAGSLAVLLPGVAQATTPDTARVARPKLLTILKDATVLRLAIATALPNMISYGTSLVAPTYIATVHGVSLAASATTVAIAKIVALLLGGTVIGSLLARDIPARRLFVLIVAVGIAAQIVLYIPASPLPLAIAGLMLWLFAFSGASGICMATMADIADEDRPAGAMTGLVNQAISIASFLTPTIYFALPGWHLFVLVAAGGMIVSLLALPGRGGLSARQTAVSPPSTVKDAPAM